jgi:hypothetical protein
MGVFGPDENGVTHEEGAPDPRGWVESRVKGRLDVLRRMAPDRAFACDPHAATWMRFGGVDEVDERPGIDSVHIRTTLGRGTRVRLEEGLIKQEHV